MQKGDYAELGGLLVLLVLGALFLALHSSAPPSHASAVTTGSPTVPPPVQTYPPYTLTPWCVGASQFAEFKEAYGSVDDGHWGSEYVSEYDFYRDSVINLRDWNVFRQDFGRCV